MKLQFLAVFSLAVGLAGNARAADVQSKIDQLNEREKQLIQKLEAVQQRERDLQSRLEEVRRRKQYLLSPHPVRKPSPVETTPAVSPAPTP